MSAPVNSQPGTVLIVDDEMDIRDGLAELIRDAGIPAATARNGAESLAYLRSNTPPSLILLDLMLPSQSGWEIQQELQGDPQLARIPVVVLSGVDDVHQHAGMMKVDGYLRKPIDPRLLLEVVGSYCRPRGGKS